MDNEQDQNQTPEEMPEQESGGTPSAEEIREENERLRRELEEKEKHLREKSEQFHRLRNQKYRSLAEMSDEEKELYTPEQLEVLERQDFLQEQIKKQEEVARKQLQDYRQTRIETMARGDKKVAEKLKSNLSRLAGAESVQTPQEIDQYLNDAWRLMGDARPNPLHATFATGGGVPPNGEAKQEKDFSDTKEGKDLASIMGLRASSSDK